MKRMKEVRVSAQTEHSAGMNLKGKLNSTVKTVLTPLILT